MKFRKIHIKGFDQFQDITLDFTNPEDGKALDKICLIGKNGTGKSRILKEVILQSILRIYPEYIDKTINLTHIIPTNLSFLLIVDVEFDDENLSIVFPRRNKNSESQSGVYYSTIHENLNWIELYQETSNLDHVSDYKYLKNGYNTILGKIDLIGYKPSESRNNLALGLNDVPQSSVNEAQKLFSNIPKFHEISNATINSFWRNVIYLIRKRDSDYKVFQNANKKKTIEEVEKLFDKENPKFLKKLAILWNKILDNANLYFDEENANDPVQLEDNLKAYIKHKGTDSKVAYNQLSTGIRDFIFKLGHIYSIYYNREVESGILLIDEPENSLYPDFLYDLIENYQSITHNTQLFFATHSPIIASQFKPHERLILEFNEDGSVFSRKGVAPEGDDPNDILEDDFLVKSIMTKVGQEKWNRYLEIKDLLRKDKNNVNKDELISEMSKIGSLYKF